MSLSRAISTAGSGLSATAQYTDLISSNIANAQTPGYVRRSLTQSERVVNGQSLGLNTPIVERAFNASLTKSSRDASGSLQEQQILTDSLEILQRAVGDIDSEFSMSSRMEKFNESLVNLAESPESSSLQHTVLTDAKSVVEGVKQISNEAQAIRQNADTQIATEVDIVNFSLSQMNDVVKEIRIRSSSGLDITALEDQRDKLIDDIAERIPVNVNYRNDGDVLISTKEGVPLFDVTAKTVEFTQSAFIAPSSIYASEDATVNPPYNAILSGISVEGRDITPTSGDAQAMNGGKIGGLFYLRDEAMTDTQNRIDDIAAKLITTFRENDTSLVAGQDSIFTAFPEGTDYSDPLNRVGVTLTFQVNPKIDADQGGKVHLIRDGVNGDPLSPGIAGNDTQIRAYVDALRVPQTFDASLGLSTNQSLISATREFVSFVNLDFSQSKTDLINVDSRFNAVNDAKQNVQGVNIDNEMRQLVILEQLYSANATVLQIAGRMLDDLQNAI